MADKLPDTLRTRLRLQDALERFTAARWSEAENSESLYPKIHFDHGMESLREAVSFLGFELVQSKQ